jgi:hypothetical protein
MRASPSAFYTWRRLTADARYDSAFGYHAASPDADVLAELAKMATDSDQRFGVNWDMFTTEVLYTDRVYYPLQPEYRWYLFGGEAPRGDRYPTFSVTWPPASVEFARTVLEASQDRLRMRAYSFDQAKKEAPVRLWRLKQGRYVWRANGQSGEFAVTSLPHTLTLPLPPRQEVSITVEQR